MNISETLISWYRQNKRELPWRLTNDPYYIWVSEVILQQTRVNQGMDYYYRFIEKFPNVASLAIAHVDEVLKVWEGLGYYSRARNMHIAANEVMAAYNGQFPSQYEKLIQLRGIGDYTASAISSFAGNEAQAVVDGNVTRLITRLFGIDIPVDLAKCKREVKTLAKELLNKTQPAEHNQAIMEFGALVCTPSPKCNYCELQSACTAYLKGWASKIPVKKKKADSKNRYFIYFIIKDKNGSMLIKKRTSNDIWKFLHDFPCIEFQDSTKLGEFIRSKRFKKFCADFSLSINKVSDIYLHKLSHQNLHILFMEIHSGSRLNQIDHDTIFNNSFVVANDKISSFAFPKAIEKYMTKY